MELNKGGRETNGNEFRIPLMISNCCDLKKLNSHNEKYKKLKKLRTN